MRKYRPSAATPVRVDYGTELVAGLRLVPETAGHADTFEALNDELDEAYEARRKKRKPLVKSRAALRFANYQTDQIIRSAGRAAEIADGGRRGAIFGAIFPDGVRLVVRPSGARQIQPTRELVDRLVKSRAAGIDAYRAEWLPKLATALADLEKAAAAFDAAASAHRDAFTTELALREEHLRVVDKLMGHVRAAFPRDKERQDLVFPEVEEGDGAAEEAPAAEAPTANPS